LPWSARGWRRFELEGLEGTVARSARLPRRRFRPRASLDLRQVEEEGSAAPRRAAPPGPRTGTGQEDLEV